MIIKLQHKMKTNKSLLMFTGFLVLVFLSLGVVSAASFTTNPTAVNFMDNVSETEITITNSNAIQLLNVSITSATLTLEDGVVITLTPNVSVINDINSSAPVKFKITPSSSVDTNNLDLGKTYRGIITITNTTDATDNKTIDITLQKSFCKDENNGNLDVDIVDVNVESGFGSDEDYWYPLDELQVKVDVENNGNWDIENIELEACLLDTATSKCVFDEDDMDLSEDKFDLDSDDDIRVTITFKIDPDNLRAGNTGYVLYVKATGEISDSDSPYDNDNTCSSDSLDAKIRNEKFIILDNIQLVDLTKVNEDNKASCGSTVQITADVWNIDDDSIDGDKIYIVISNKELGIYKVIDMNDIGEMDREILSTTIVMPSDAVQKLFAFALKVYDDEDVSDSDIYENSEDDEAEYQIVIEVVNCAAQAPQTTISATLASAAKVGEDLVIQVSVTNTGADATYTISAEDYGTWAELVSVEPQALIIPKDSTKNLIITLKPSNSGTQTFNIKATPLSGEAKTQQVSVTVSEKTTTGTLTGAFAGLGDTTLWITAIIFLVLIVVIVLLIIRVARTPKASEF